MKMKLIFISLTVFTNMLIFSQSIKVIKPNGNIYGQKEIVRIMWVVSGISGNLKITLRRADGSGGRTLATSIPVAKRFYDCSLQGVQPGKYFIKIKQGKVFGKSSIFTIQEDNKALIKFIYPKSGDVLYRYDNIIIRWKYIGFKPKEYGNIYLLKYGKQIANVSATKSEYQSLTLTKNHPYLGDGFKFKIVMINPVNGVKVIGYSQGTFSIKKKVEDKTIQKISIPLAQNQNQYLLNQNNRIITSSNTIISAKPDIIIKHIKLLGYGKIINNKVWLVKGSQLNISLQLKGCIRAQISEETSSFPLIKKINIKKSRFNGIIKFPANTNMIRIEAYNSFGWSVKKIYCEFIHRNHFERPDLELEKVKMITLNPKEGDTVEFTATIINKGYKIPWGMHIEVLAEADNDIYNTSLDYRLKGLAHNKRMKFNFRFKNKFKHGKHLIVFKIDPKHLLDDRYTGNNKKELSFEVK